MAEQGWNPIRLKSWGIASCSALAVWGLASCAGKGIQPPPEWTLAPSAARSEIPEEFRRKYDVREVNATESAVIAPLPAAVAKPSPLAKKKSKDRKRSLPGATSQGEALSTAPSPSPSPSGLAGFFPKRRPAVEPIWEGESLTYEVTYFGMVAGEFTLTVKPPKEINHRKVYHFSGQALSSRVFSLIYRLEDQIESFFDYEGLFSHQFHMKLNESKQVRDSLELFDSEKGRMFFWNRLHQPEKGFSEKKEYADLIPFSQDSLSALYYLRCVPLELGSVFSFPVASESKNWEAEVTVMRRELVDWPLGKTWTWVVKPETKFQGVLKKNGDSFLWLTDDARRIPVRLEAKIKIGTVVAQLKKVELGTPPSRE